MAKRNFWVRLLLIASLASCGGSDKKDENQGTGLPNTSFFMFKANVTGLKGTLILSNNGKNEVTIQSNGAVTLPNSWTQEGNYEIKVMDEPCAQRCIVDQPRGQISTNGNLTLNVDCEAKRWDIPTSHNDALSIVYSDASNPVVAMNHFGDTILSWFQTDNFNMHLFKREFINRSWNKLSSIVNHYSFSGSDSVNVSLDFNNDLDGSIAWVQEDDVGFRNIFVADASNLDWIFPTSSININANNAGEAKPIVRVNASGDKIMLWTQAVGNPAEVKLFKAEYQNGSWNFPTDLTPRVSLDGSDVVSYDVAINDQGDTVIVWSQSDGDNLQLFRAIKKNGVWVITPTDFTDDFSIGGTDTSSPRVALSNIGNAYIVWYQYDAPNSPHHFRIYTASSYDGGLTWDDPTSLNDNIISPSGKHASYPKIMANDQGQAVAVFRVKDETSDPYQIYAAQKQSSTSTWESSTRLSTDDFTETQGNLASDMDEYGNVIVAWSSSPSGKVYKAERRDFQWAKAQEGMPISYGSTEYNLPAVAANNCRSIVAWQQEGSLSQKHIFVQQYR